MSERQLGNVLITGLGLWSIVQALVYLGSMVGFSIASQPEGREFVPYLVPFAIAAACGGVLLILRHRLSNILFGETVATSVHDSFELVAGLLAVLGIYFACTALVDLISFEGTRWLQIKKIAETVPRPLFDLKPREPVAAIRLRNVGQLIIGIVLFLGARGLAGFWRGLRSS